VNPKEASLSQIKKGREYRKNSNPAKLVGNLIKKEMDHYGC